jgi:ABC-type transport system substrate-binding protein
MLLDREAIIDTIYNVQPFKDAGIPVTTFWNSHLGAQATTWLDPRKSELGEGAKYFKFDPAEAKKMLSAASASSGKLTFWYHDHYGRRRTRSLRRCCRPTASTSRTPGCWRHEAGHFQNNLTAFK